jgi:hypothetical protein
MEKIAMKCTEAQYESIREFVGELRYKSDCDFDKINYLINDFADTGVNTFVSVPSTDRLFYETFNKDVFLKACGIKIKKDKRKKMFKKTIKLLKSFDELNFDIQSIDTQYGTDGFFEITITGNKTK